MTDWNKAKVVDLKAELKKRGLPQTGLKPALVARLAAAENEDGAESEATVQGDSLKLNASAATSPDTVSPTQPQSTETLPDAVPQSTSEPNPTTGEPTATSGSEPADIYITNTQDEPLPAQSASANTIDLSQTISQPEPERSALPSVEPQEAIEDRQKRKRRSQTPPISSADAARKRFRKSDEAELENNAVTTFPSDSAWSEKDNLADEVLMNATSGGAPDEEKADDQDGDEMEVDTQPNQDRADPSSEAVDSPSRTRGSRFKDLFTAPQAGPDMGVRMEKTKSRDSAYDEVEPERAISPAIHPATSALYIRDFMRPLNPGQLKSHLVDLATPQGHDVDADVVVDFYLDQIRTHAFVSFATVSAATRVRSKLHDRIWPDERTRKPLWVDFVPSDVVKEWIEVEESYNTGRGLGKKWGVYYDVDEDRRVTASLQEANSALKPQHTRKPSTQFTLQAGPVQIPEPVAHRGIQGAPSGPRAELYRERNRGQRAAANIATLDQLFRSTSTKPVLYWEPVSELVANKRLDAVGIAKSKRYTTSSQVDEDINRYTFEDGHVLVDRGPELFGGIRPPRGFRGPGRGGTTRVLGGRGAYGGGSGAYGGGSERGAERVYDSYRGGVGDRRGSRDERVEDRGAWRDYRDDRRY